MADGVPPRIDGRSVEIRSGTLTANLAEIRGRNRGLSALLILGDDPALVALLRRSNRVASALKASAFRVQSTGERSNRNSLAGMATAEAARKERTTVINFIVTECWLT